MSIPPTFQDPADVRFTKLDSNVQAHAAALIEGYMHIVQKVGGAWEAATFPTNDPGYIARLPAATVASFLPTAIDALTARISYLTAVKTELQALQTTWS